MVTALTNTTNAKLVLDIPSGDDSQNTIIQMYVDEASRAITDYCKLKDFGLASYTRVLSGANVPELALPDVPVQCVTLTGDLTSGSKTVTNLAITGSPNANNLFVSQSVMGTGVPDQTIISDVSSAATGTITLSNAATATGTAVSLAFGVAIWADDQAMGGAAFGAFDSTTQLFEGTDFYLDYDSGPGTQCSSGIVYRIGFTWFRPSVWVWGLISPQTGPRQLNVKAVYLAGYPSIPSPVESAALQLIARLRWARKFGAAPTSAGNADLSVSLPAPGKAEMGLFTPEIRTLLAPYAKIPMLGN